MCEVRWISRPRPRTLPNRGIRNCWIRWAWWAIKKALSSTSEECRLTTSLDSKIWSRSWVTQLIKLTSTRARSVIRSQSCRKKWLSSNHMSKRWRTIQTCHLWLQSRPSLMSRSQPCTNSKTRWSMRWNSSRSKLRSMSTSLKVCKSVCENFIIHTCTKWWSLLSFVPKKRVRWQTCRLRDRRYWVGGVLVVDLKAQRATSWIWHRGRLSCRQEVCLQVVSWTKTSNLKFKFQCKAVSYSVT